MGNIAREKEFDIAKAIAIVMVVIGHCIQLGSGDAYYQSLAFFDNFVYRLIYTVHMPLLMIISGYFFEHSSQKKKPLELFCGKIISIGVPIFAWVFLTHSWHFVNKPVYTVIKEIADGTISSFWFLWAVILSGAYMCLVLSLPEKMRVYAVILGGIATFVTPDLKNSHCCKFMYVCFIFGYYAAKYDLFSKAYNAIKKPIVLIMSSMLYIVLFLFFDYDKYIYNTGWTLLRSSISEAGYCLYCDAYRTVIGILGSTLIIVFCMYLVQNKSREFRLLSLLGSNTLGIYIVSTYLNAVLKKTAVFVKDFNLLICLG